MKKPPGDASATAGAPDPPALDRPAPVRAGEELDVERLLGYLRGRLPGLEGPLQVEQFPRGFSNLTYLLRTAGGSFVLRRPPFGAAIRSAHDMGREHRILAALAGVYPKAPRPLLYCEDEAVLGAPFYVMERVKGVILRAGMPEEMRPEPALMGRIAVSFVETLAELHRVDYSAAGLGDLGRPEGYVRRQIEGWGERWTRARTDEVPEMERLAAWLAEHQPGESGAALIHNDFKYDNLVLDPGDWASVRAVLDWEMATLGDPLMDLGTTLGYWVEAGDPPELRALALSPTAIPGNPGRRELVELYARSSGREPGDAVFPYVYGLFKIAVIVQQIYRRYTLGHTRDPRFANLIEGVRGCARAAARAVELRRIDGLY